MASVLANVRRRPEFQDAATQLDMSVEAVYVARGRVLARLRQTIRERGGLSTAQRRGVRREEGKADLSALSRDIEMRTFCNS